MNYKKVKYTVINIAIGMVLYILFMALGFMLGLASSDKYVPHQWALYGMFIFIHFLLYTLLIRRKLSDNTLGLGTIMLLWIILALLST